MLPLFIQGLIIGFAIAAPVGPIGVLCIQRSLHGGFKMGLMTGMGAMVADGVFGSIAGSGLTAISSLLIAYQFWIRSIGGLFLLYLGIKLFLTSPQKQSSATRDRSLKHAFVSTFFLTLTNPMAILSFIAVFAGLGLGTANTDYAHAAFLVLGIMLGSGLWWLLLSGGVAFILHHRLNPAAMQAINRLSGIIILLFAVFIMI